MRVKLAAAAFLVVVSACSGGTEAVPTLNSETPSSSTTAETTTSTTAEATTTTSSSTTTSTTTTTTTLPSGSVEEDARAVVLAGMPGTSLDATTAEFLAEGGVGIILFAKNLSSADQVRRLTSEIACAGSGRVIVAVDQEPGRVARLEPVGVETPSIQAEEEIFREQARALGRAMALIGVNLDLAPVVDVVRGDNPVLVGRNFGPDAAVVAKRGVDFILALEESGVGTTAKHFPGHGLSTVDPHLVVTPISASLAELEEHDFLPFHAAIKAGVAAVMVGHPIYAALDVENPASLSPAVLTLLREEFGFEGVAMTDAFSMAGVRAGGSVSVLAQQAIAAGEDMLIVDNPAEVSGVVAALETAVEEGLLDRARLAEAAGRVRRLAASLVEIPCDA